MTPHRASRLLLTERDALLPLLRSLDAADFDRPTVLPGWSVRDVLAHCAAALTMAATGTMHTFSPADNEADVATRRGWPIDAVLTELDSGYTGAAEAIATAGGVLDGIALGEWVHGGDVRDALGIESAYATDGVDDALAIAAQRSRGPRLSIPPTRVTLTDREALDIGTGTPDAGTAPVIAEIVTDTATFIRLIAGRRPDPVRLHITGADPAEYVMFS